MGFTYLELGKEMGIVKCMSLKTRAEDIVENTVSLGNYINCGN